MIWAAAIDGAHWLTEERSSLSLSHAELKWNRDCYVIHSSPEPEMYKNDSEFGIEGKKRPILDRGLLIALVLMLLVLDLVVLDPPKLLVTLYT